jgi:exoribonuclease R
VTAPLRRLGDRYAGEICVALCAGVDVPDWVVTKLHELPQTLQASGQRANRYERSILDLVEAGVLADRVGDSFDAVVVEVAEDDPTRGELTVPDPAVEARVVGSADLPLGQAVKAKLTKADVESRSVEFAVE